MGGSLATAGLPLPTGALAGSIYAPAVFGRVLNGLATQNGAGFGFVGFEATKTLVTTGVTSTINLTAGTLPVGAIVWGASVIVTTTVADVNSTDLDVQITGDQGSGAATVSVSNLSPLVAGDFAAGDSAAQNLFPPLSVTVADTISIVLSGGGDNTPSAGAVRVAVFYTNTTPLLS